MNRCAVTTLLAVAAVLTIAPAASAEIVLTDASQTGTTTPGTTTPGTTTSPTLTAPSPGETVPGAKDDPDHPITADVETGSSMFKLGGATGSAGSGSGNNNCTVLGSAASLGGFAGLGCGPNGPGTVR